MKNQLLTILLTLISSLSFCQSYQLTNSQINDSGANQLMFSTTIDEAEELAQKDIKSETPFLLLEGGISPIVYDTDSLFEATYHVFYYENGCSGPDNQMLKAYNSVILNYLQDKFGRKWRKTIRKDVIGYKEWKN
ncbi:hypothetical protein [Fulvivirga ligni]|uniref:FEKKY domain-containing protein n=1 Tax=Fulvivirga ligni TaxID=2904246 RepID=UPI001F1D7A8C|nr:hypothetical protein [Fulvivirga ligni]UII20731.1 hypothetical protein LVD16_23090 [Fulvivirga ligni]